MYYQFEDSKYKEENNKILQEYFLADFENQKFLIVSKDLESEKTKIFNANWEKEIISNLPIVEIDGKGLSLNLILQKANIKKMPQEATIVSHSPPFHADDLMACALMAEYFKSKSIPYSINLSRDQKVIDNATAAVDVGGKHDEASLRFDHHQLKSSDRAATGLVADFLKKEHSLNWVSQLSPSLKKIDNTDLGKTQEPSELALSEALGNFNTTWREKPSNQFFKALGILQDSLEKARIASKETPQKPLHEIFEETLLNHPEIKKREKEVQEAKKEGFAQFINSALAGQKTGIAKTKQGIDFYPLFSKEHLDKIPENESKALKSINYITFETPQGAINAIAAPKPENRMEQKHPFPQSWRGKRGHELIDAIAKSTGGNFPPVQKDKSNEYFCHNAGFFLTIPDKNIFEKAIEYCSNITKEKDSPKRNSKIANAELWGRGGPV